MALMLAMAPSRVKYRSVNVTSVLPNGTGAKIDTVTAMLDNAVEDYGFARGRNLFVPTEAEHIPGYMSVMKNFSIRRVRPPF